MSSSALPPLASGPETSAWRTRLRTFRELLSTGLRAVCIKDAPADALCPEQEPRRPGSTQRARFVDLPGGTVLRQPTASERWERW
ncbi:MAG TPA: hypothetical protein VFG60_00460 [Burkholderiaceae bacterium]|nr:hypothetical protein [Burkholderiaceae bacterium]